MEYIGWDLDNSGFSRFKPFCFDELQRDDCFDEYANSFYGTPQQIIYSTDFDILSEKIQEFAIKKKKKFSGWS